MTLLASCQRVNLRLPNRKRKRKERLYCDSRRLYLWFTADQTESGDDSSVNTALVWWLKGCWFPAWFQNWRCVVVSLGTKLYTYFPLESSSQPAVVAQPDKRHANRTQRRVHRFGEVGITSFRCDHFGSTISAPIISLQYVFCTDRFGAKSVLFDSSLI